jgi:Protein of unknown function (DUF2800)
VTLENGSASATERTFACGASLALPRVHRTDRYAEKGHDIHSFVRAVLTGIPPATALERVDPEHRATCRKIEWHKLCADLGDLRCEASYALDVVARSARFLGLDIRREYERFGLGPNEVPGSDDIEGTRIDGVPVIVDLKSGYQYVTDAAENGQGLFFGAVKHLMLGADEVEFRIAKLKPDGQIRVVSSATYTAFEIDSYLDRYAEALVRARAARRVYLAGGMPDVSEGDWCGYCECHEACPAKSALARAMITTAADLESRVASLPLVEAGRAWNVYQQMRDTMSRIGAALESRARNEPLPIGDEKVAREVSYEKTSFSSAGALELLKALGATDEQIAALHRTYVVSTVRETRDPNAPRAPRKKRAA